MEKKIFKSDSQTIKLLAQERTILAVERNTLAYIRTGFSAFLLGIALVKFFETDVVLILGGWLAILIGIIFILIGLIAYPVRKKKIKSL
jgi:uncharacterized membrane protein YidH (DUF202 family)